MTIVVETTFNLLQKCMGETYWSHLPQNRDSVSSMIWCLLPAPYTQLVPIRDPRDVSAGPRRVPCVVVVGHVSRLPAALPSQQAHSNPQDYQDYPP